jgi:hypothetical protein
MESSFKFVELSLSIARSSHSMTQYLSARNEIAGSMNPLQSNLDQLQDIAKIDATLRLEEKRLQETTQQFLMHYQNLPTEKSFVEGFTKNSILEILRQQRDWSKN